MQEIFPAHYESVGGCFSELIANLTLFMYVFMLLHKSCLIGICPKASHIRIIIMWHVYVTNQCNYERPLFLVTIVMSLRFCALV